MLQLYFYYATDKGYADYTEILKRRRDQVIGKLIDKKLALSLQPYIRRPSYQGYYYSLIVSADRKKYVLWAVPTEYGKSGLRSYWMSSLNWRIYAFDAKELTIEMLEYKDSPPKGYYELGSRF